MIQMDIQATKLSLIHWLTELQDQVMLRKLEKLRSSSIIPEEGITIDQYNNELEEAERRVKKGEYYTQDQVENMLSF